MAEKAPPDWATQDHGDILPGVEVRLNADNTIDEVICTGIDMFHLEQMGDGQYWIGLTRAGETQHIMLTRHGKAIYPTVYQ